MVHACRQGGDRGGGGAAPHVQRGCARGKCRVGSFSHFIFKKRKLFYDYKIKTKFANLCGRFSFNFGDWPRRALSLAISPS